MGQSLLNWQGTSPAQPAKRTGSAAAKAPESMMTAARSEAGAARCDIDQRRYHRPRFS